MRMLYVNQRCTLAHGSAFPRYVAHHPGIELVYVADLVGEQPLDEPIESFQNTHFEAVPEWADVGWMEKNGVEMHREGDEQRGPAMVNNGYQKECVQWKYIEAAWRKHYSEPPDLIVVYESAFLPCGDKDVFRGVPCAYLAPDAPRGVDSPLRAAKSMGATDIFQVSKWHQSLFSMWPHKHPDTAPRGKCSFAPNSGMFMEPEHVHWLPMCADPHFFRPADMDRDRPLDIMWCGNERWLTEQNDRVECEWDVHVPSGREIIVSAQEPKRYHFEYGDYQQRSRLLYLMLQDPDVPLQIVRSSYARSYSKMMQSAKIVWHCQCGWSADHMSEAYRIWQATMSGCCLVTNETESIGGHFELGKEIETFRLYYHHKHDLFTWFDYQEMKNKLLDLLDDEDRRLDIEDAVTQRVLKDHMPKDRWRVIFEKMGMEVDL